MHLSLRWQTKQYRISDLSDRQRSNSVMMMPEGEGRKRHLIEHRRGDFTVTKSEIYVDYEYGDLKEVIVGVPLMIYPDLDVADWVQEALKVLPESERKKIIERSGKTSIEIGKYDAMEKENQELIAIFQNHGIKVWRPEVLSRERLVTNLGENVVRYCGVAFQYRSRPDSSHRRQRD